MKVFFILILACDALHELMCYAPMLSAFGNSMHIHIPQQCNLAQKGESDNSSDSI